MRRSIRKLLAASMLAGCYSLGFAQERITRLPPLQPAVLRNVQSLEPRNAGTFEQQSPQAAVIPRNEPPRVALRQATAVQDQAQGYVPPVVHELLTMESLQAMAAENNPSLAQAAGKVHAAEGKYIQAGLPYNPEIGYSGQQLGSPTTEQHGVMVSQEFIRGNKLSLQQQAACHEWSKARQLYQAQYQRVMTDARNAYFDVLVAQELIQLNQKLIEIANQSAEFARRNFAAKEGTKIDTLQAKIEADQARLALQRAHYRIDGAWRKLVAVVGVPLTMQPVAGTLSSEHLQVNWEEAWGRLSTESPELAAAYSEIERAKWMVHRERAEPIPNVTVQAVVQHDQDIRNWDGALQVSIPIPIRNKNQGNIIAADGELQAAERNLDRLRHQLQQRLAETFQRYQEAKAEVERYTQDIIPAAQETLKLTTDGYQAGEFPFINVLTVQRTLFQARLNQVEALGKLQQANSEMSGLLLSNSLNNP